MDIPGTEKIKEKLENVIKATESFNAKSAQLEAIRADLQNYLTSVESVDAALKEFIQKCGEYVDSTQSIVTNELTSSVQNALSDAETTLTSCRGEIEAWTKSYSDSLTAVEQKIADTAEREISLVESFSENSSRISRELAEHHEKQAEANNSLVSGLTSENANQLRLLKDSIDVHADTLSRIIDELKQLISATSSHTESAVAECVDSYRESAGKTLEEFAALVQSSNKTTEQCVVEIKEANAASVAKITTANDIWQKNISDGIEKLKTETSDLSHQITESRAELAAVRKIAIVCAAGAVLSLIASILSIIL